MDGETLHSWMSRFGEAWEKQDPLLAEALFATGYTYKETPFTLPIRGHGVMRRYWQEYAVGGQRDIHFGFAILAVAHDFGIVHWRSELTLVPSGQIVHLDGIARVSLDEAGQCTSYEQWYHRMGGRG